MIDENKIKYLKGKLNEYYLLKRMEQKALYNAMVLQLQVDQERCGKGISYEDNSNGCSGGFTDDPYIKELMIEQAGYDIEAKQIKFKYERINREEHIEERIKKLSNKQQALIYAIFRKGMSISNYAKEEQVCKQTMAYRVDSTIEAMLKEE